MSIPASSQSSAAPSSPLLPPSRSLSSRFLGSTPTPRSASASSKKRPKNENRPPIDGHELSLRLQGSNLGFGRKLVLVCRRRSGRLHHYVVRACRRGEGWASRI